MQIEKKMLIRNKLGLHARAATQLVKLANQFSAQITIVQGEKQASANSVLGLMMLQSQQGREITVLADGEDAAQAMEAVEELITSRFHEEE